MAIEHGVGDLRKVPIPELRAVLVADGMVLDPEKHEAFAPQDTRMENDDRAPNRVRGSL